LKKVENLKSDIKFYLASSFIFLSFIVNAQTLTFSRVTSGLQAPEFEGGCHDFRMDDIKYGSF
jgi:hypothetical protein